MEAVSKGGNNRLLEHVKIADKCSESTVETYV